MRVEQLTFTRFIAALIVVIFHFGSNVYPFSLDLFSFLFERGDVFVSYFFVLSGFVMVLAYSEKKIDYFKYLKRRVARIYPIHIVSLAILFISYLLVSRNFPFFEFLIQSALVHTWYPKYSLILNYPSWSLAVEVLFYVLFPFIIQFLKNNQVNNGVLVFGLWMSTQIISYLMVLFMREDSVWLFISFHPLMHLNEFLIGCFTALVYLSKPSISDSIKNFSLIFSATILLLLLKYPLLGVNYKNGFLAPVFSIIIYALSGIQGRVKKILSLPCLVILGEISYALYILQVPVHNLSYYLFGQINLRDPAVSFYLYLLVLMLCSYLSFFIIETPAKRFINSLNLFK
ncbi:acyltransferase family protein [Reichenbachiella versicolor]|uniref:acyltransferase family protein n=1 Tax=Reichenbachiella versicolor TaxID=1821036 RepID=UPI0013A55E12|nr:acyltransferase [Reichenbachiella versicolor]